VLESETTELTAEQKTIFTVTKWDTAVLLKKGWNMAKHCIDWANQRKHQLEPNY
jgi:hypothetical protein